MNRRSFLKLFAAAGPVAAVAPTYFFAPVGGWKSDVVVNPNSVPTLDRVYFLGKNGIYENGKLISTSPELWGLPYWQVNDSGVYAGISRSGAI
jgi:hypothetical protein